MILAETPTNHLIKLNFKCPLCKKTIPGTPVSRLMLLHFKIFVCFNLTKTEYLFHTSKFYDHLSFFPFCLTLYIFDFTFLFHFDRSSSTTTTISSAMLIKKCCFALNIKTTQEKA